MNKRSDKTPTESSVMMTEIVLPNDTNVLGNLLGGRLMHWIDIAAALAAMKHSERVCVTASVDEINFLAPTKTGHIVTLYASVNRVFRTSMEVGVRVVRLDPLRREEASVGNAYLTFVGIDEQGAPVELPQLRPTTSEERRRYEEAGLRRTKRLEHRAELALLRDKRRSEENETSEL